MINYMLKQTNVVFTNLVKQIWNQNMYKCSSQLYT